MSGLDDAAGDAVLQAGVRDGLWPGLVAAVGVGRTLQRTWVLGAAEDWDGGHRPMSAETIFDVASLTKVLATLPAVLVLAAGGELRLSDAVGRYVPGVDDRVTVQNLLTHTSGLPAHVNLQTHRSAEAIVAAAAATAVSARPGSTVSYSDLGFILLGGVVSAVTGEEFGAFVTRSVFAPLGMAATFAPAAQLLPRIATTELVDGAPVHGRVHDENAAAAGEPVGHAGVFCDLDDVVSALNVWLPPGRLIPDRLRVDAMRDHTVGLDGHRGLGWTCRGDYFDILSPGWGDGAVSHTGFTGTSMALDPDTGRWAVLLTNAVHYGRGRPEVFARRRRFHAALVGD